MDVAHRRLTPDFTSLYISGGGMNCVSYDMCVYHFCFVFFPWGIPPLQSDWSLSCNHGLDYASYVRTTTLRHTQLARMSFDEILDLTLGCLLYFTNYHIISWLNVPRTRVDLNPHGDCGTKTQYYIPGSTLGFPMNCCTAWQSPKRPGCQFGANSVPYMHYSVLS